MPEENITVYAYDSGSNSRPELSMQPVDKRPAIIGGAVALVILLVFVGIGWWLFVHPARAAVIRDISIIFMGLGVFVIILLLIILIVATFYLVLKVNDVVRLLDREIRPVLDRVQTTMSTVKGTTVFLGDKAVKPVMTTAGYLAAVRAIVRSLFRRG